MAMQPLGKMLLIGMAFVGASRLVLKQRTRRGSATSQHSTAFRPGRARAARSR